MDKVVDKLAGMGVAGLVLVLVMATTGFAGAAALTAALAALGGPFGMVGGVGVLLVLSALSTVLAQYGVDAVAEAVIKKMIQDGTNRSKLKSDIESFPLITDDMKRRLKAYVDAA